MRLEPLQSAGLANNVYALSRMPTLEGAIEQLNVNYKGAIEFAVSNMLAGKTGGPGIIKVRTAFGFVLVGKQSLEGKAFIVFRGTQYLADWLTNLNILFNPSVSGQKVHEGFNKAFKSMVSQIRPMVAGLPVGTDIHCIGHSLGGALATLAAEWLTQEMGRKPYLYTFGSPRVGLEGFSKNCVSLLGKDRMYRVHNKTDIVPCIPIWPFVHTPNIDNDYLINTPGIVPSAEWHDMRLYVEKIRKHTWQKLLELKPVGKNDIDISNWLKSNVRVPTTSEALEWIGGAIVFVMKTCLGAMKKAYSFVASTSVTVMDKLAYILDKAIRFDEILSAWVVRLMVKIAQFLGWAKSIKAEDLTRETMHRLLLQLSKKANDMAYSALSNTLANGRAI
jgi:hypothetical protein